MIKSKDIVLNSAICYKTTANIDKKQTEYY